jgi:hypothetical protein
LTDRAPIPSQDMLTLRAIKEESRLGQELGVSNWHLATQQDIDELTLAESVVRVFDTC